MRHFPFKLILRSFAIGMVLCSTHGSSFTLADDLPPPKFILEWGKKGDQPGEFYSPIGLVFNSKDELFVTDLNNARVQKFTTTGEHLASFNLPRDNSERKSTIIGGIVIDEAGLLYLSFMNQHKIGVYSQSGDQVREWGQRGENAGQLHQPGGMLFTPEGDLLVADQCNHRLQKFTRTGKFLAQWGGYGTERGQFDGIGTKGSRFGGPHFVAQDNEGRIYTTEGIQSRVQQFSPTGEFLMQWGDKGNQPGGFGAYQFGNLPQTFGPIGIFIDRYDRVYVSSLNDRVQGFDTAGKYLFGIEGTGLENGGLLHPHGMVFDSHDCLYIADAGNQRIVKFEVPPPPETK
ncbi:MAG: hypothetical protein ACKVT0_01825 [Planctomycetaceae bacterium]